MPTKSDVAHPRLQQGIFSIGWQSEWEQFWQEHGDGDYEFKESFHEQYGSRG